jgi:hypothetical protein
MGSEAARALLALQPDKGHANSSFYLNRIQVKRRKLLF